VAPDIQDRIGDQRGGAGMTQTYNMKGILRGFKIVAPSKYLIPLITNEIGSINAQIMPDGVN
jgi:hypothetical protein